MTASLHIYLQMIEVLSLSLLVTRFTKEHTTMLYMWSLLQENPEAYKDLTSSIVTILKQVLGGKLPIDFNYRSVPAPWLQIQLLRILALLGKNDQR